MALPPPLSDPSHIEMRLLVVAEMLERAVAEVHRAMADIKIGEQSADPTGVSPPETSSTPSAEDHEGEDDAA